MTFPRKEAQLQAKECTRRKILQIQLPPAGLVSTFNEWQEGKIQVHVVTIQSAIWRGIRFRVVPMRSDSIATEKLASAAGEGSTRELKMRFG